MQVKDVHVALGDIQVADNMQKAAVSVTFWCNQEAKGWKGGNTKYTFWSMRDALATPGTLVSVPSNRLRLKK
jgi:hypothetical protein